MNSNNTRNKNKKSRYDNCPEIQLIIRTNDGWRMYKQNRKNGKIQISSQFKPCGDADITFSSDGKYFAVLSEEGIEIYDSYSGRNITFLKHYRTSPY